MLTPSSGSRMVFKCSRTTSSLIEDIINPPSSLSIAILAMGTFNRLEQRVPGQQGALYPDRILLHSLQSLQILQLFRQKNFLRTAAQHHVLEYASHFAG